jgi:transmembrane sensor
MSTTTPQSDNSRERLGEAADWLMTLRHEELSTERVTEWLEWSHANPENLEAFDRVESLSLSLNALDQQQKTAVLRKLLPEAPVARSSTNSNRRRRIYALAASLALAAIGTTYFVTRQHAPFSATYTTAKAENRAFDLPDGSRVELGARTQLDVAYTSSGRTVELRDGEAYFDVQHDAHWPFAVHAGTLHLTDIGTRFDVRKSGTHVVVTVAEGVVDVQPQSPTLNARPAVIRVNAGERVTAEPSNGIPIVAKSETRAVPARRSGRLDFQNEPLSVVIANVNRYATREIVIVDPDASRMRFTGTVFESRVDDWLTGTLQLFDLRAGQAADGRILLYAKGSRDSAPER